MKAVAVLVAIGLAAWLLWPKPPVALHSGTSRYVVSVTIDPPRMGDAMVTVDLAARDGSMPTTTVEVAAVMPLMGLATPEFSAMEMGTGHYMVHGLPLMMTGPWELHVFVADTDLVLPFTVTG